MKNEILVIMLSTLCICCSTNSKRNIQESDRSNDTIIYCGNQKIQIKEIFNSATNCDDNESILSININNNCFREVINKDFFAQQRSDSDATIWQKGTLLSKMKVTSVEEDVFEIQYRFGIPNSELQTDITIAIDVNGDIFQIWWGDMTFAE